jgi:hypothetical protein
MLCEHHTQQERHHFQPTEQVMTVAGPQLLLKPKERIS